MTEETEIPVDPNKPLMLTYTFSPEQIREILLEAAKTQLAVKMDEDEQDYQILHEQVENRAGGEKLVHLMYREDEDTYGE